MSEGLGEIAVQDVPVEAQEKVLRQSEVNEIVGREKKAAGNAAVEAYKRQVQQEQSYQQPHHSQSNGEMLNEDRIRKMAAEEAQRLRDEWYKDAQTNAETQSAQRIVKNFYDKIATGKDKYDDFDKVTNGVSLQEFPNVVQMLSEHIDNADDVLYELSKNDSKFADIEIKSERYPRQALSDLKRLSESIKNNEQAAKRTQPNAPLSQQRPTNIGTDSGGALSFKDLKAKYRV